MPNSKELADLEAAIHEASKALRSLQKQRDKEEHDRLDQLRLEINQKYSSDIDRLIRALHLAEMQYQDAVAEAAKDKLKDYPSGVVVQWDHDRSTWSRKLGPLKPTRKRGRYEIRTRETQFPANRTWGFPDIGEVFIRLLKKDGSPSLGYVKIREWDSDKWLPEGETPTEKEPGQ